MIRNDAITQGSTVVYLGNGVRPWTNLPAVPERKHDPTNQNPREGGGDITCSEARGKIRMPPDLYEVH